ncbi:hypothetical protein C8R44DRAFT_550650, partial [Mycena epipterygia]
WEHDRQQALSFEYQKLTVIIIGGGHSGLDLAARLKYLDVRTLIIQKNARVGDN